MVDILAFESATIEHKGRGPVPNRILYDVSFSIHAGEALGLVGESGSSYFRAAMSICSQTAICAACGGTGRR